MAKIEPNARAEATAASLPVANDVRRGRRRIRLLVILGALAGLLFVFALFAGRLLVTDRPQKSDVIVVLAGDSFDERYNLGMKLLREGYGKHMFLDVASDHHYFGRLPSDVATEFLDRDAGDMRAFASVCPYAEDSTVSETGYVARCLVPLAPRKVLLVTSDYHSARALSIFRNRVPQYEWSVAAARDPDMFGVNWWRDREWAKTTFLEWLKVAWWNLIDRWR